MCRKTIDSLQRIVKRALARKPIVLLMGFLLLMLGSWIRWTLRDLPSIDSEEFLVPWYHEIKNGGGVYYLGHQVGDYNILYQTLIALFTYVPMRPLYAYKLLSCCFDGLLAVLVACLVYRMAKKHRLLYALAVFGLVYLSPIVLFNSAWWGQCDAIYTFFGIAAYCCLMKQRDAAAFLLYGVSITFKLQAIFLMPVFLFTVFCRQKRHLLYILLIPVVMVALSAAGLVFGRSVTEVFTIYLEQTNSYLSPALNYPSVWGLVSDAGHLLNYLGGKEIVSSAALYHIVKYPAILLAVAVLAGYMFVWMRKKVTFSPQNMLIMAFVLTYTCVILLPAMHERYGYLYEILSLVLVLFYPRLTGWVILLHGVTLCTYLHFLTNCYVVPIAVLSVLNIVVYLVTVRYLCRQLFAECDRSNPSLTLVDR